MKRNFINDDIFWNEEIQDEKRIGKLERSTVFRNYKSAFYNFSYISVLNQLENGEIQLRDLGIKM